MLILPTPSHAQEEIFGSSNAMHGTLGATSDVPIPVEEMRGDRVIKTKIKVRIRYKLWKLVGEPVMTLEPQYQVHDGTNVPSIKYGDHVIMLNNFAAKGTVEVSDGRNDSRIYLTVSKDLWDRIHVRDFQMLLHVDTATGYGGREGMPSAWVHMYEQLTAVMDGPERWGWDVPGSPAWKKLFYKPPGRIRENDSIEEEHWMSADRAKHVWNGLWRRWKAKRTPPLEGFELRNVKFSFWRFFAAVEKISPGATAGLLKPERRRGESDPDYQARSAEELQLRSLINGVVRASGEAGTEGGSPAALRRRISIVDRAMEALAPSEELKGTWEQAKILLAESVALARVRKEVTQAGGAQGAADERGNLSRKARDELKKTVNRLKASGLADSPRVARVLDRLKGLGSGGLEFRGELVGEWQPPKLGAGANHQWFDKIAVVGSGEIVAVFTQVDRTTAYTKTIVGTRRNDYYEFVRMVAVDGESGTVLRDLNLSWSEYKSGGFHDPRPHAWSILPGRSVAVLAFGKYAEYEDPDPTKTRAVHLLRNLGSGEAVRVRSLPYFQGPREVFGLHRGHVFMWHDKTFECWNVTNSNLVWSVELRRSEYSYGDKVEFLHRASPIVYTEERGDVLIRDALTGEQLHRFRDEAARAIRDAHGAQRDALINKGLPEKYHRVDAVGKWLGEGERRLRSELKALGYKHERIRIGAARRSVAVRVTNADDQLVYRVYR